MLGEVIGVFSCSFKWNGEVLMQGKCEKGVWMEKGSISLRGNAEEFSKKEVKWA